MAALLRKVPRSLVLAITLLSTGAGAPPPHAQDLERLREEMRSPSAERRLSAALHVARGRDEHFDRYVEHLRRPIEGETDVYRALIHAIWAQYPNPEYPKGPGKYPQMWLVRPEPRWVPPPAVPGQPRARRPPPHDPEKVDWLTALAGLDLEKDELVASLDRRQAEAARAEALFRVALLRSLSAIGRRGRMDAVHPIFEFAFVRDGIFRDECGRMIREMGSYAVPGLIRIYQDKSRGNAKMRRYASYQLDRMDRLRPVKAITLAPDDAIRAEIIHAYGEWRALDAVEAVLGQLDASSQRVRREARWAWMRYVDGPPPPPPPRRKRKLPGGKEEAEEKEDYLDYREMATLAVRKALKEMKGTEPDAALSAKEMTDQLIALYDSRREAEFRQLFDAAMEQLGRGNVEGAVDRFGWILSHQPDHPRRAEMAPAYLRLGQALAQQGEAEGDDEKTSRALGLLRQALALSPDLEGKRRVRAQIHFLDGQQARRRGADGLRDFTLAVAADPTYPGAQAALARARREAERGQIGWGTVLTLLVLGTAIGFLLWRRHRGEASASPDGLPSGT